MRPIRFTYTPTANDVDAISLVQQTVGAGNFTIDGVLASGGVATLGSQQFPTLTSTGNISGVTFTLTGTDIYGNVITAARAGPNNNTVAYTTGFSTVTQVAVSGAVGTDTSVGVNGLGYSRIIPLDVHISPFNVSISGSIASGTATYKVQYTYDDVSSSAYTQAGGTWIDHASITGETGTSDGTINDPVTAVRAVITTAGGGINLVVIQAGL